MGLSVEIFSYLLLKSDRYFNRLSSNQMELVLAQSIQIGKNEAKFFEGKSLREELSINHVKIQIRDDAHPVGIFSQIQIDPKKSEIQIFLGEMEKKRQAYIGITGMEVTMDQMIEIHLAHEFYHYIEMTQNKRTEDLVEKIEISGWRRVKQRRLLTSSEIAAHSFAMEYCNWEYHPLLMDYGLHFSNQKKTAEEFLEYMEQIQHEYERRILYGANTIQK